MTNFTITANTAKGIEVAVRLTVSDVAAYFNFVDQYSGDDLGNDIILQDFVVDTEEIGHFA